MITAEEGENYAVKTTPRRGPVPGPPLSVRNILGHRFRTPIPTHEWHRRIARTYGDLVRLRRVGPLVYYVISGPAQVERVLRGNQRNYRKPRFLTGRFSLLLGDGLFTADGDHWLRHRRLMQPMFHRRRVERFGDLMTAAAAETARAWEGHARTREPVDLLGQMAPLTLRIVTRSLLGADPEPVVSPIIDSFGTALRFLNLRLRTKFPAPFWLPLPSHRRFRHARAVLDRALYDLISARRRSAAPRDDLLAALLDARDADTGAPLSDREIRDELATIVLAGHETSAVALSWVWYMLSQHPGVERRLHEELDRELAGRTPTVADLPRLTYTDMVIRETLRLYPPAWVLVRQARDPDVLAGYRIPAGAIVVLYPYIVHRHPDYWRDPDRFDPERFDPSVAATRPEFAYFPFGGGARGCIGAGFAQTEIQLVLATLAQRFYLRPLPGHCAEPEPTVTLRPSGRLPMTIHARSAVSPAG